MFRVVLVALAHLAGGTSFPEALAYRGLGDSGGYIQRLTEYCLAKDGEYQFVDTDGSEMLKNDAFCHIYPSKIFESLSPVRMTLLQNVSEILLRPSSRQA